MRWIEVDGTHVNTVNVRTFFWLNGTLTIWWGGDTAPARLHDPDQKLYLKMCHNLGILPFKETTDVK